jgi:hypothetical protein
MTISVKTFSMTLLSMMTLAIMTFNIVTDCRYVECRCVGCRGAVQCALPISTLICGYGNSLNKIDPFNEAASKHNLL